MIYTLPHVTEFSPQWDNVKIQWEVVHLPPSRSTKGRGIGSVFLDVHWLEYIRAMNTPQAFQWMIGAGGTIIWGVTNKKNLGAKENKARMPVIGIGGNQIDLINPYLGFGRVVGLQTIDYDITPQEFPMYWHRIWCVTKIRKGISAPHDTPRGPAFMPILDVSCFRRQKALADGVTYCKLP